MTRNPLPTRAGLLATLTLTALFTACSPSDDSASNDSPTIASPTNDGVRDTREAAPLKVTTGSGTLRGTPSGAAVRYLGIPYAAPPLGERRWAPPAAVEPWEGVRPAEAHGPRCPQPPGQPGTPGETPASAEEDCLFLDVTVPAGTPAGADLPVMVWFHGGGLRTGAGGDYDATTLAAEQGIAVVTVNYRLGALGFLDLPGVAAGGQWGLLDQQAALRWVAEEIASFGGDPTAVTVAGESAGADSVCAQLVSPQAADLIDAAVVQSGTCSEANVVDVLLPGAGPAFGTWKSDAVGEQVGAEFAGAAGCPDPGTALTCLRELPVEELLRVATSSGAYFSPTVGTGILPTAPAVAIEAGDVADVPVLTGVTQEEGLLFLAAGGFTAAPLDPVGLAGLLAATGNPAAAGAYPVDGTVSPNRRWAEVVGDRAFTCPNLTVDRALARNGDVFVYEFADDDAPEVLTVLPDDLTGSATHGAELPYLFPLTSGQPELAPAQQDLARTVRDAWGSFVRNGSPGTDALAWPELGSDGQLLRLTAAGSVPVRADDWARENHCALWAG